MTLMPPLLAFTLPIVVLIPHLFAINTAFFQLAKAQSTYFPGGFHLSSSSARAPFPTKSLPLALSLTAYRSPAPTPALITSQCQPCI